MKLKNVVIVLFMIFSISNGVNANSSNHNLIVGKLKGQTIDGKWMWTITQEDGSLLKIDWKAISDSGNKNSIKTMKNKTVAIDGTKKGTKIVRIKSLEIYKPSKVIDKPKAKVEGLSGVIKQRFTNDKAQWTLEAQDGKIYQFNWQALKNAGLKSKIKNYSGKTVQVEAGETTEEKGNFYITNFKTLSEL